jgi:hypothetical protein
MCEPVTIAAATFGLSAASAGISYLGEQTRARETERYRRENADAAVRAFGENAAQLSIRRMEEDAGRVDELERIRRQTRVAQGEALASATSDGGISAIVTDLARQGGYAVNTVQAQEKYRAAQYSQELIGARARALDAINSIRPYIPTPVAGLAVDIGKAGLQGATTYQQLKFYQQNPKAYGV